MSFKKKCSFPCIVFVSKYMYLGISEKLNWLPDVARGITDTKDITYSEDLRVYMILREGLHYCASMHQCHS